MLLMVICRIPTDARRRGMRLQTSRLRSRRPNHLALRCSCHPLPSRSGLRQWFCSPVGISLRFIPLLHPPSTDCPASLASSEAARDGNELHHNEVNRSVLRGFLLCCPISCESG